MTKRTLEDWQRLLKLHATSGLTVIAFCKQHKLTTSNFYKYRAVLQAKETRSDFVKVALPNPLLNQCQEITLNHGSSSLTLPPSCDPLWLANLMKALHA